MDEPGGPGIDFVLRAAQGLSRPQGDSHEAFPIGFWNYVRIADQDAVTINHWLAPGQMELFRVED